MLSIETHIITHTQSTRPQPPQPGVLKVFRLPNQTNYLKPYVRVTNLISRSLIDDTAAAALPSASTNAKKTAVSPSSPRWKALLPRARTLAKFNAHREVVLKRALTIKPTKTKRRFPACVRPATHAGMFLFTCFLYLLVVAYGLRAAVHTEMCVAEV